MITKTQIFTYNTHFTGDLLIDNENCLLAFSSNEMKEAKKEFDNRRKYLKVILNAITEVSKKYKNIPGIEFDSAINTIKCFIAGKDYEDNDTGWDEIYEEFLFMHDILPICTPKEDDFSWAYTSKFYLSIFNYDIWDWAENGPYKNDFKSNKPCLM